MPRKSGLEADWLINVGGSSLEDLERSDIST